MRKIDYPRLVRWTYSSGARVCVLRAIDVLSVAVCCVSYILLLVFSWLGAGFEGCLLYIFVSGAPFILLSLVRRFISAPRPAELYPELLEYPIRKSGGGSFPSRHVFSAFLIGTLLLVPIAALGGVVLSLGVLLAVSRVLLGKHFIRDVIAGAALGAVSGALGCVLVSIL